MTNLAIAANGLHKSYGDKVVLDGIDLAVPEGTIFSLLGPNGAGRPPPPSTSSPPSSPPTRLGGSASTSVLLAADPQAGRAAVRRHRAFCRRLG